MVYVTRIESFNAAHRLFRADWSEEKNNQVFGKCANKNWHGHNFTLHVTVAGISDSETGFVIDLKQLKTIIKEHITDKLDHKNMNTDVPFLENIQPSIENVIEKYGNNLFHIFPPLLPFIGSYYTKQIAIIANILVAKKATNFVDL